MSNGKAVCFVSTNITGIVTNGVIVPNSPLPEGTRVEIPVKPTQPVALARCTPGELRKMPRAERQAILAAAAALAECRSVPRVGPVIP
jgi:hypothetical protein